MLNIYPVKLVMFITAIWGVIFLVMVLLPQIFRLRRVFKRQPNDEDN